MILKTLRVYHPFSGSAALRRKFARRWYLLSIVLFIVALIDPLPDVIQIVSAILGGIAALALGVALYWPADD